MDPKRKRLVRSKYEYISLYRSETLGKRRRDQFFRKIVLTFHLSRKAQLCAVF